MATFNKYPVPFNHLLKSPGGLVGQYLKERGAELERLAKAQVGVDSGDLRRSIKYELTTSHGSLAVKVTASDKKAMMHHEGTRPHTIRPRRKQTLRFHHRGRIVYAKVVNHPGTKPNRFLTDNLRKVI